ncbi:hypothetical protein AB0G71_17820 [Streptomyces sp. NPDC020403]|uniref:hypothetical protein n=1 Tax=unclassified Streptomyces TaxID=2593676 RepID=UPI0033FF28B7
MGTHTYDRTVDGERLADVPVDTFRSHIRFIERHNLWDEVRGALGEAGIDTVAMDIRPVRVISELVAAKEGLLPEEADHSDAVVTPECGCDSISGRPPVTPVGGGDAGAGDAGERPQ